MSKIFTTKKGTDIPLMNLKGKDYMMVAYRIQWFTEEVPSFKITTTFSTLTDEQTVAHATVQVLDPEGRVVREASGTKRETKKDFADHTEKAETAAIGRALIQLGFGTQFALSDMEEGMRLADSPLEAPKKATKEEKKVEAPKKETVKTEAPKQEAKQEEAPKATGSRFKPKAKVETATTEEDNGWN